MDETVAEFIRRTVLRMTRSEVAQMLAMWGFLPETQLHTLNVHQKKENLSQEVVQLCEVRTQKEMCKMAINIFFHHLF